MALTRRNRRFAELAALVEAELKPAGMPMSAELIDAALNAQVDHVAQLLGIAPGRALSYAPDDAAKVVAQVLVEVAIEEVGPD
jgi:hypothetical protein